MRRTFDSAARRLRSGWRGRLRDAYLDGQAGARQIATGIDQVGDALPLISFPQNSASAVPSGQRDRPKGCRASCVALRRNQDVSTQ